MKLNASVGFTTLYIYTCLPELRFVDYGSIAETEDKIELVSEVPTGSPRKKQRVVFVKVKWGTHRFLVEETSLAAFSQKAVGTYVEPDDAQNSDSHKWSDFWMTGPELVVVGLPQYPEKYKHVERKPITSAIARINSRVVGKEIELGNAFYTAENAVYDLSLSSGSKQGVRKGMVFSLNSTSERIVITRVTPSTARAVLVRPIDDRNRDQCWDESSNPILCKNIRSKMKISTLVGDFKY